MDVHGNEDLTLEGGGTHVHWAWDFATRGPLRLLGPLIGWAGRRMELRVWVNMKETLDAAATYPGAAQSR